MKDKSGIRSVEKSTSLVNNIESESEFKKASKTTEKTNIKIFFLIYQTRNVNIEFRPPLNKKTRNQKVSASNG